MDHMKEMLGEAAENETPVTETEDTKTEPKPAETDKTDTGTETAVPADTETETAESEQDPEALLLKQYGLDKYYHSLPDALASIKHKDQTIAQMREEQRKFTETVQQTIERRLAEASQPPEMVAAPEIEFDQLSRDPRAYVASVVEKTLEKVGVAKKQDVDNLKGSVQQIDQRSVYAADAAAVAQHAELADVVPIVSAYGDKGIPPGKNRYWDEMLRLVDTNPTAAALARGATSLGEAVNFLLPMAKASLGGNGNNAGKPAVLPLTPEQKAAARTSGGPNRRETKKTLDSYTQAELDKMPLPDLERLLDEAKLIDNGVARVGKK